MLQARFRNLPCHVASDFGSFHGRPAWSHRAWFMRAGGDIADFVQRFDVQADGRLVHFTVSFVVMRIGATQLF